MPEVPARPAAYIRVEDAATVDDPDMTMQRNRVIADARDLGWPVPALYADAGQPGSQHAALVEAITARRHDAVIVEHPKVIGTDLAQVEALDRHCTQHGAHLCGRHGWPVTADTRELFDVIRHVRHFTVTDDHLRLLRRAYVFWDNAEFGAPSIDPKRPYGNSDVYSEIAEILSMPSSSPADQKLNPHPDTRWHFLRLHVETAIALQIALATSEFTTGRYTRDHTWDTNWQRDDA